MYHELIAEQKEKRKYCADRHPLIVIYTHGQMIGYVDVANIFQY